MKRSNISNSMILKGTLKNSKGNREIEFHLQCGNETVYAFTRRYTNSIYSLCKSGIRVNELMYLRTRDTAIMNLVKYSKRIIPYLIEYYEFEVA